MNGEVRKTRRVALAALCAALYALVGYASYLGLFAPVLGVVRFWPSVFVPAVFAVAFGPQVGGLGAAIGIFISDMAIHGNALLSLTVGVPANFVGFYTVGFLARRLSNGRRLMVITVAEEAFIIALVIACYRLGLLSLPVASAYCIGMAIALGFTLLYSLARGRYAGLLVACSTGLLAGAAIIGIGVYAYSQFFTLPSGAQGLPLVASLLWTLWVYVTEIPFMVALTPPIVDAIQKVYPGWFE